MPLPSTTAPSPTCRSRKKELFKTAKGKYVAPAPIEGRLPAHPMIEMALVAGSGCSSFARSPGLTAARSQFESSHEAGTTFLMRCPR